MVRVFNHYFSIRLVALTAIESAVLFSALLAAHHLRLGTPGRFDIYVDAALFAIVQIVAMSAAGMYSSVVLGLRTAIQRMLAALVVGFVVLSVVFFLFQDIYIGRGVLLYAAVIGIVGVATTRFAFDRLNDFESLQRRVLILGPPHEAQRLQQFLERDPYKRTFKVCGIYEVWPDREVAGAHRRQDHDRLRELVTRERVSEIVLAVSDRRGGILPLRQLLDCKIDGVKIVDLVAFHERETGSLPLEALRASWLIQGSGFVVGRWRDAVKRAFDLCTSVVFLVGTLPIILIAMLAIYLETGTPILYRQTRVGERGRPFTILKLRSMYRNAEQQGGVQWARRDDARITHVGRIIRKFRIDELPQLWNVLRGEMSFVGPRPERPEFVTSLARQIPFYEVRHCLKPGITGWAQVRFTYGASVQDAMTKLQYDLYYAKNHSLMLDLIIMIETLEVVVLRKGAL